VSARRRIFIVEPDGKGGLIHFAHLLAQALSDEGADVTLITSEDYELADLPRSFQVLAVMKLWERVDPPGATFARRPRRAVRRAWRGVILTREWMRISKILLRERPDFTLFSVLQFPILGLFLRRIQAGGLVLGQVCHEFETREAAGERLRRVMIALGSGGYQTFSAIFFLTRSTRDAFLRLVEFDSARAFLIPHGPELLFGVSDSATRALAARYGLDGERVVLLFGGLRPSKGVPELLEAFARLSDREDVRLVVAGYPSKQFDVRGVQRLVRERGLEGRVALDYRYVPIDELGALVTLADVVVFPYRTATASGALALAQFLGRPVVATDVGGLSEDIRHGVTGLLVPQGDTAALAQAIGEVLDDPARAARMGEAGRNDILEHRSWSEAARRILAVVDDVPVRPGDRSG
jgi:glycosyltransferase involved in cell wall biosynthesis